MRMCRDITLISQTMRNQMEKNMEMTLKLWGADSGLARR